jgi:hypothetical protein
MCFLGTLVVAAQMGAFVVVKKYRSFEVLLRFIQGAYGLVTQLLLFQNTIDAFGYGVFQRVGVLRHAHLHVPRR